MATTVWFRWIPQVGVPISCGKRSGSLVMDFRAGALPCLVVNMFHGPVHGFWMKPVRRGSGRSTPYRNLSFLPLSDLDHHPVGRHRGQRTAWLEQSDEDWHHHWFGTVQCVCVGTTTCNIRCRFPQPCSRAYLHDPLGRRRVVLAQSESFPLMALISALRRGSGKDHGQTHRSLARVSQSCESSVALVDRPKDCL